MLIFYYLPQMTGSYWTAILILSELGLWQPLVFSPVFLLQLIYKGLFLVAVILPRLVSGRTAEVPVGIAAFFLTWVVLLPFVIPWGHLFPPTTPTSCSSICGSCQAQADVVCCSVL